MRDRDTGRSRGFGFVTYASGQEAQSAIAGLNDKELDGRRVKVNLANARGQGGAGGGMCRVLCLSNKQRYLKIFKNVLFRLPRRRWRLRWWSRRLPRWRRLRWWPGWL